MTEARITELLSTAEGEVSSQVESLRSEIESLRGSRDHLLGILNSINVAIQRDQNSGTTLECVRRLLSQRDTALAEGARLREALDEAGRKISAAISVHMPESDEIVICIALREMAAAIDASPLSALAARVIEAAVAQRTAVDKGMYIDQIVATNLAVDALNAERAK